MKYNALIADIIERFGGRLSGSEEEDAAQDYMLERWQAICDTVAKESFKAPMDSKFGGLKVMVVFYFLALFMWWQMPMLGFACALLAAFLTIFHFVSNLNILDPFFPKQDSSNVVGTIEPKGEAKATIIVSGHIDSVREFQWWYYFKSFGAMLTMWSCILITALPIAYFFWIMGDASTVEPPFSYWIFLFASPILTVIFFLHGKRKVDGAIDNLSGIAVADAVAQEVLELGRLQNIRIKAISLGAEEMGTRGAYAYAKQHLEEMQATPTYVLNVDSVKATEHITIIHSELNSLTFHNKPLIARLRKSFADENIGVHHRPLIMGGTDASQFTKLGVPALSIVGIEQKRLDPTYHTRLDTVDNLDEESLVLTTKALMRCILDMDQELSK